MAGFALGEPEGGDRLRSVFGPGQLDHSIRQAIQLAWMMLPEERQTVEEVERVVRHLVDRALKDLREDGETFGKGV
jgi:hypothetical protein